MKLKKKRTIIILLQLIVIVAFTAFFYMAVQKEVEPVEAYVFSKNLEVNSEITASDITKISVPAKAVTKDFALDPDEIIGKYVKVDVFANQFVYKNQLVEEGKTDPFKSMDLSKYRKISLPIDYVEGFGGDLRRGDRVDLVFTGVGTKSDSMGQESQFQYSKVFLQDVLVYSVTTGDGYEYQSRVNLTPEEEASGKSGEEISATSSSNDLKVVTLAVTLDQAEEIVARQEAGTVRLLSRFDEHESYETLGYVLGDYEKIFSAPANAETSKATVK